MTDFATLQAVPGGSTNGTPLPNVPPGALKGVTLYLPAGATLNYAIASSPPASAPQSFAAVNPAGSPPLIINEVLASGQNIYITGSTTGTVLFRWLQGG